MRLTSLFSGIGGFELGFGTSGIETVAACEAWGPAQAVLGARFPGVLVHEDVRTMRALPECEVVTAGFPCTDLSQAGRKAGIDGAQSGLVREVLRLLASAPKSVEWVVLENVRNMVHLARGRAMRVVADGLEALGWRFAYRVVDARAFGLPQRRERVILVASPCHDPRGVLFADEAGPVWAEELRADAYGFYWTEGRGGIGWVQDGVPALKAGSGVGAPSQPAIWLPHEAPGRLLVLPGLEDGEALQGFPRGWTEAAGSARRGATRWRLVGNAVPVPLAAWVGRRLVAPGEPVCAEWGWPRHGWPAAAWGDGTGRRIAVAASAWPVREPYRHLSDLLDPTGLRPLSPRATAGFLGRLREGRVRADARFVEDVEAHLGTAGDGAAA